MTPDLFRGLKASPMHAAFTALRPLIGFSCRRPLTVILLAVALGIAGLFGTVQLDIDTDISGLLPQGNPSVEALGRLQETVGGENAAAVAVTGGTFESSRLFAEDLIPEVLSRCGPGGAAYFTRVDYRRDASFMEKNALYFATDAELSALIAILGGTGGHSGAEDEGVSLHEVPAGLNGFLEMVTLKEYPVSDDSLTMVLLFHPSGSQTDIAFIGQAYAMLDSVVAELDPSSYHPDMTAVIAGRLQRHMIEVKTVTGDVTRSLGLGVLAVMILVSGYFVFRAYRIRRRRRRDFPILLSLVLRAPVLAGLIAFPLLLSLLWTFGLARLMYGSLNIMTSVLGLILFGLSIDYGIHFFARYSEERACGRPVDIASANAFMSTGKAIAIAGLTTAISLFVLLFAEFRGFSEFGFIAGTGIMFGLLSMLIVLPALLALLERSSLLSLQAFSPARSSRPGRRMPAAGGIMWAFSAAMAAGVFLSAGLSFEYDFDSLEPDYEEYEERQQVVRRVYPLPERRNPAYILLDGPEDAAPLLDVLRDRMEEGSEILAVEALQERFPSDPEARAARLELLREVRRLLDPSRQLQENEHLARLRTPAGTAEPIELEDVPGHIRDVFAARDGSLGEFVMIYPRRELSDGRNSLAFRDAVGTIRLEDGSVYHAASTSIVAAEMLHLIRRESLWFIGATLLLVAMLILLNFCSFRSTMLAMVPLVAGMLCMVPLMRLTGVSLNFYNMIVLPLLLGIGNDAGVHIVHRYLELGKGSIRTVLRTTGEHVTMASLTTMIGFSGCLLSSHPGIRSIGAVAVLGIATTLLGALLFLPAIVQILENRGEAPPARSP